ncbi:MAG: hypothetical protein ACHP6H_07090, partial [Legionellales bacterium]
DKSMKSVSSRIADLVGQIKSNKDLNNVLDLTIRGRRYKVGNEIVIPRYLAEQAILDKMGEKTILEPSQQAQLMKYLPEEQLGTDIGKEKINGADQMIRWLDSWQRTPQWAMQLANTERGRRIMGDLYSAIDNHVHRTPHEIVFNLGSELMDIDKSLSEAEKSSMGPLAYQGKYTDETGNI